MRLLLCLFLSPLMVACTFSAPQLESGVRFIQTVTASGSSSTGETQIRWLASVGTEGAVLKPYATQSLIVFASADGDAISFDGWIIRSITGFGLVAPISILGKEGERTFIVRGSKSSAECGPWQLSDRVWSQVCDNGDGSIIIDEDGNIESISMSLGEPLRSVTLRVVK